MGWLFTNTDAFNRDISNWDTSKVTNMQAMFKDANGFNQDISDWNVSLATNMTDMFQDILFLSDINKGLIHQSFSSNSNWPYDWSSFVNPSYTPLTDANFQTAVNPLVPVTKLMQRLHMATRDWNTSAVTNMNNAFRNIPLMMT